MRKATRFFPVVGALIGLSQWCVFNFTQYLGLPSLVQAFVLTVLYYWLTRAMHLDGLGDIADALGPVGATPQKRQQILKESHLGTFGVVSVVLAVTGRLILLGSLTPQWMSYIIIIGATCRTIPLLLLLEPQSQHSSLNQSKMRHLFDGFKIIDFSLAGCYLMAVMAVVFALTLNIHWGWTVGYLVSSVIGVVYWKRYITQQFERVPGDSIGSAIEVSELWGYLLLLAFTAHI
jgi:adenosylcobinamide-GDP ribazoletransferase